MSHSMPPTVTTKPTVHSVQKWFNQIPLKLWQWQLGWLLPRNCLVLTTIGRKSGLPRQVMVQFWYLDGCYYIVSGRRAAAQWFQNLQVNPRVTVQSLRYGTVVGDAKWLVDAEALGHFYDQAHRNRPLWRAYLNSWGIADRREDFVALGERLYIVQIQPTHEPSPPLSV